jgi:Protein of unknown function (DUF4238)
MTNSNAGYRHNHYVPVWYQRRFMLPGQDRYFRLDLNPETVTSGKVKYKRRDLHEWSPDNIFAESDLYTTRWGEISNTEIEQFFFGQLDARGLHAVDCFGRFDDPTSIEEATFQDFLRYISVQKLRTPKGLANLAALSKSAGQNMTLMMLQRIQDIFCATWTECVWQIADASNSPTKFIISDHPVTIYNRACPPLSDQCLGHNDPDIRMAASHTIFPLSLNKALLLTNLNWARDPYQNEKTIRPNPQLFRTAIFKLTSIQTGRMLSEDEVLQINMIIKRRAYRYLAGADKEWLYPEKRVSTDHWKKLGGGYLLMPEPRLLFMGGEILIGYEGGSSDAFGEYGHKPWQEGFKDDQRFKRETAALYRFKAEYAMLKGAQYIARDFEFGGRSITHDDEQHMQRHRELLKRYSRRKS